MRRLRADERVPVRLTLNGVARTGYATPRLLLSDFLRHELGATGTDVGCEHGVSGACTVQVDGRAARSCLMLAVQAEGCEVRTVEGLAEGDGLTDLQAAFRRHHALQCGYCTPGMLMTLDAYLSARPKPDADEIRAVLSGHLCRCTGYVGIVAAVLEVAAKRHGGA